MAADGINIELLAQRLAAQEKVNSGQAKQIEALTTEAAELRGRFAQQDKSTQSSLKLAGPVIGVVFALGAGFVAYSITGRIDRAEREINADQVEIAQRFERKDERILALTHRLEIVENRSAPSLSGVNVTLENISTRLGVIEGRQRQDDAKFEEVTSSVVALQSNVGTLGAGIAEHEEEIDALEESFASSNRNIASIRASVAANFVEVETQIRAWVDTANLRAAYVHSQMQQIQNSIDPDNPLPDLEFFPQRIPAQAITNVGEVGGRGE